MSKTINDKIKVFLELRDEYAIEYDKYKKNKRKNFIVSLAINPISILLYLILAVIISSFISESLMIIFVPIILFLFILFFRLCSKDNKESPDIIKKYESLVEKCFTYDEILEILEETTSKLDKSFDYSKVDVYYKTTLNRQKGLEYYEIKYKDSNFFNVSNNHLLSKLKLQGIDIEEANNNRLVHSLTKYRVYFQNEYLFKKINKTISNGKMGNKELYDKIPFNIVIELQKKDIYKDRLTNKPLYDEKDYNYIVDFSFSNHNKLPLNEMGFILDPSIDPSLLDKLGKSYDQVLEEIFLDTVNEFKIREIKELEKTSFNGLRLKEYKLKIETKTILYKIAISYFYEEIYSAITKVVKDSNQKKYKEYVANKPRKYENHCWRCGSHIDSDKNEQCSICGWYICSRCGACSEDCNRKK